jgi:hypothetical protein
MPFSDLAPVFAFAGVPALALVLLLFAPDAVLRLLAGIVAIVTRDEGRGKRCLEVLRILRRGGGPPELR